MKIMAKNATFFLLCLLALNKEALCQTAEGGNCNTPIQCYQESLYNLQIARKEIKTLKNDLINQINALRNEISNIIPKNTVAAFNMESCPFGWNKFGDVDGRVIVGSGNGNGLSPRIFGDKGGEEAHLLTVNEMPKHRHQLPTFTNTPGTQEVGSGLYSSDWAPAEYSEYEGGDKPHNNMQPYLVLTICIKQ